MSECIVVFTCKTVDDTLKVGGCGWWKVDVSRVRKTEMVLFTRNAFDPRQPSQAEMHKRPFLIGRIADVRQDTDGRSLLQLSEFADVTGDFRWPGYRNPVAYMQSEDVLAQVEIGDWHVMPSVSFEQAQRVRRAWDEAMRKDCVDDVSMGISTDVSANSASFAEIIAIHRNSLAAQLGLSAEQIRISIDAI